MHWAFVEFAYIFTFWFIFTEPLGTIHFKVYSCNGKPCVDFACSVGCCNCRIYHLYSLLHNSKHFSLSGQVRKSFTFCFCYPLRKKLSASRGKNVLYTILRSLADIVTVKVLCYGSFAIRSQHCHLACYLHLGACFFLEVHC